MGSSSTKEVGTEVIEQENTTNGGFHILEVQNQGDQINWRGLKNDLNYYCNFYLPSHQIHGKTATFGLVTLAVIGMVGYIAWRVCRRRWQRPSHRVTPYVVEGGRVEGTSNNSRCTTTLWDLSQIGTFRGKLSLDKYLLRTTLKLLNRDPNFV